MPPNRGPEPYHPDPKEEGSMDGVEVASPILSTQVFDTSVVALQTGIEPEFVLVSRSKATHWLKFPVSCFDKGTSMSVMSDWAVGTLQKVASIKPKSFAIVTLPTDAKPKESTENSTGKSTATSTKEQYLIFQVYTTHEAEAACEHGSKNENGHVTQFAMYTPEAQALHQGRILHIISLSYDTTEDHIRAALSKYGIIERVKVALNAKATMATATVIYESGQAIEALKSINTTYVQVRDDIATVTWLGNEPVKYDSFLTKKLALLPTGITPVEIAQLFRNPDPNDPNATPIPFHSIVMPRNIYTSKRQLEAHILFSSPSQQQIATSASVIIGSHKTCWVNADQPTCRHCGDPTHFVSECYIRSTNVSATIGRLSNIQTIKARTQTRSTASRPFTQVHNSGTSAPAKKQSTATRSTPGMSYASAAAVPKNRGSAVSNPITIGTSTPPAVATSSSRAASATTPLAAQTGNSTNRSTPIQAQMAKLEQQQQDSIASIRADMQANNASLRADMQAMFTQFLSSIRGTGTHPNNNLTAPVQVAEVREEDGGLMDEDIDLVDAPTHVIVLDSQTPDPASVAFSNAETAPDAAKPQGRPVTPPAKLLAYSVNSLRPNNHGGKSFAKGDSQREESVFTERGPSRKGKAVVRDAPQDNRSASTDINEILNTLNETIQELRADLARQREIYEQQITDLRNENKQLMNRLDHHFSNSQSQQYGTEEQYGEVDHYDSATPHGYYNTVKETQEPQSDPEL